MRVVDAGHLYALDVLDSEDGHQQALRFVKRYGEGFPGNVGSYAGTNCQEVLRALIDRVKYLDGQIPHIQNSVILFCLREALLSFEVRAAERHGREIRLTQCIEFEEPCEECGHVQCHH